jgi:hypothetical protein
MKKENESNNLLFDGLDGRSMSFAGVGSQDVEEIGKFRHGNGLVGFLVAKVVPVLCSSLAISTNQFHIVLCQGEPGSEDLCFTKSISVLVGAINRW